MQEQKKNSNLKAWAFDWGETVVVAFALAFVIKSFFFSVFWIPSGSMIPTLDIQDRIVVNMYTYHFREPQRFEVVVFRLPEFGEGKGKELIKRVIGLPGEKLEVVDGEIYINDQPLKEVHKMEEGFSNFGPVTIPSDSYFMMGDNRPNSADSRYWGYLPKKNMIGPAFLKIWPIWHLSFLS